MNVTLQARRETANARATTRKQTQGAGKREESPSGKAGYQKKTEGVLLICHRKRSIDIEIDEELTFQYRFFSPGFDSFRRRSVLDSRSGNVLCVLQTREVCHR